jgi:hypothetical protein
MKIKTKGFSPEKESTLIISWLKLGVYYLFVSAINGGVRFVIANETNQS